MTSKTESVHAECSVLAQGKNQGCRVRDSSENRKSSAHSSRHGLVIGSALLS